MIIDHESGADAWEVEALLDTAFGAGRKGLSAYRLRDGVDPVPELSLVARDESGAIAGTIRFWPIRIGHGEQPLLLLGPIAVHPTRQGEGIGAWLILEGLDRARRAGWSSVLLVGDHEYYGRFGFSRCQSVEFPPPTDPRRVLWLPLAYGNGERISGKVRKWSDGS